jgi:hypothetical protein
MSDDGTHKKLKLHIYLTLKRKTDSLASFFFWRSFTMREVNKLSNKEKKEKDSLYKNPLTNGPV